ncbi:MAG: hypothetical protein IPP15_02130 [Saprospiraceae bacterium]|uniref:Uncharacterized protein n=1 Tax=Candidatus Opimibacter skivensis TaxID=2982028 RepID=A0A9D7SSJ2_9BACT|nr:hypothetical protein [Candidatus Opimibacter skivensis]
MTSIAINTFKQTPLVGDLIYRRKSSEFMELDFYYSGGTWPGVFEINPKTRISIKVFSQSILEKKP